VQLNRGFITVTVMPIDRDIAHAHPHIRDVVPGTAAVIDYVLPPRDVRFSGWPVDRPDTFVFTSNFEKTSDRLWSWQPH